MSVSTTFSVIANGCALADFGERRLLIDPWCVGDLYRGAWSCYPTPRRAADFVAQATDCFISHIHEDHCDPATLALLPKDLRILLPDRYPNHVLRRKVEAAGLTNIVMIKESEPFALADGIRLTVVPPLNTFGQELAGNRGLEEFVAAIDTGLLIERDHGGSAGTGRYLFLADNTPYDLERFLALFPGTPFDLVFFPYNGFADDYPLCYDNLGRDEKMAVSTKRSQTREATMAAFAARVEVKGFVPYSSDFAINGPRQAEFFDIHPPEFLHKDLYARRFSDLAGVPAYALYEDDRLVCADGRTTYLRQSTDADRRHFTPRPDALQISGLIEPGLLAKATEPRALLAVLQAAAGNLFDKCAGSLDRIAPWQLHLEVDGIGLFRIDFARRDVATGAPAEQTERLVLSIGAELLLAHMARTLHWNNSQIGCYLTWRRLPNSYNAFLYSALNYFHLPLGTTLRRLRRGRGLIGSRQWTATGATSCVPAASACSRPSSWRRSWGWLDPDPRQERGRHRARPGPPRTADRPGDGREFLRRKPHAHRHRGGAQEPDPDRPVAAVLPGRRDPPPVHRAVAPCRRRCQRARRRRRPRRIGRLPAPHRPRGLPPDGARRAAAAGPARCRGPAAVRPGAADPRGGLAQRQGRQAAAGAEPRGSW